MHALEHTSAWNEHFKNEAIMYYLPCSSVSTLGCWLKIFFLSFFSFYLSNGLLKYQVYLSYLFWHQGFVLKCHILFYLPLSPFYEQRNCLSVFPNAKGWLSVRKVKENQSWCTSSRSQPKARLRGIFWHSWFNCRSMSNTLGRVSYRINSPLSLTQWDLNSSDFDKFVLGFLNL